MAIWVTDRPTERCRNNAEEVIQRPLPSVLTNVARVSTRATPGSGRSRLIITAELNSTNVRFTNLFLAVERLPIYRQRIYDRTETYHARIQRSSPSRPHAWFWLWSGRLWSGRLWSGVRRMGRTRPRSRPGRSAGKCPPGGARAAEGAAHARLR